MIKLTVKFLCISALLFSFIVIAGCGGSAVNNTPANNAAKKDAPKTDAPKTDAPAGDKVGVAECDEYLEKLEACLTGAPEAARPGIKSSLETTRKQWKDAAANPQTKAGLATGCKAAMDAAKQSYSYCKW